MKLIDITELDGLDFLPRVIGGGYQSWWKAGSEWNVFLRPRPTQAFLYVAGCTVDYIFPDGRCVTVGDGESFYIPRGFTYKAVFRDVTKRRSTLLINFDLEFEGELFNVADEPTILPSACTEELASLYSRLSSCEISRLEYKGSIMLTLARWARSAKRQVVMNRARYGAVMAAVEMIESSEDCNFSIEELADACHISESLFRKRFHECFGVSPKEYCLNIRIEKAKHLMASEGLSVSETCDALGFSSPAYFSRIFKEKVGTSPKKFSASRPSAWREII